MRNILAVVQPLDKLNDLYQQASQNSVVSSFSWSGTQHPASPSIVAESRTMRTVLDIAATVSQVDSAVLLLGESGTGKEVVANYIHSASTRSQKSLVVVNCASLPENLLAPAERIFPQPARKYGGPLFHAWRTLNMRRSPPTGAPQDIQA